MGPMDALIMADEIKTRRVKALRISAPILLAFFKNSAKRPIIQRLDGIPEDAQVVAIEHDSDRMEITLYLESEAFPEEPPYVPVQTLHSVYMRVLQPPEALWQQMLDVCGVSDA